jgi:hypothetical protein
MSLRWKIALGWGAAVALGALLLAGFPGIPADEAGAEAAGVRAAGLLVAAPGDPVGALRGLAKLSEQRGRPLLAESFHGFAGAGGERLRLGPIRGLRLGTVLVAGLLTAALALAAFALGGPAAALLAPVILWCSPRLLAQGLLATPDLLAALAWFAATVAAARSLDAATRLARTRAGISSGLLAAVAAAARPDLASLVLVLVAHWALGQVHLRWLSRARARSDAEVGLGGGPAVDGVAPTDWAARLRRVPVALGASLVLVPAALLLAWPWLWADPVHRLGEAMIAAHGVGVGVPRAANALVLAAAALPAPVLALFLLGLGHAGLRLFAALRDGDGAVVRGEMLLLLATILPLGLAAAGLSPRLPGLRPVLQAVPLLALLAARALVALAAVAWPARRHALAAALAILLLYPALRASVVSFPHGASAWGELLGGAPGAAWRGWPRQDGGEAVVGLLPGLRDHAAPGARIAWVGVDPWAVARWREAGWVRADLAEAPSLGEADLVLVARQAGERSAEYAAWTALGTDRAVGGVYLDEVPLAQLFARSGAWR